MSGAIQVSVKSIVDQAGMRSIGKEERKITVRYVEDNILLQKRAG